MVQQQLPHQTSAAIHYPDSDGQPMADNTLQFRWIVTIKENLERLFANDPNVFVAGDLLWYPVKGNNTLRRAPDAMVAFGRPKGDRGSYKQWEEGDIAPQVVFEILSPGNRLTEMAQKLAFYDHFGVEEYYLFDPDHMDLSGWLRQRDEWDADKFIVIDSMQGWISPRLQIRFDLSAHDLQIFTSSGDRFLTYLELAQAKIQAEEQLEQAEEQLEQERQRAEAAEQKVQALEAKLRELQSQST